MEPESREQITRLLRDAQAGDRIAFDAVYRIVYDELHALARRIRRGGAETLNTTALVHEAYLKLAPGPPGEVKDRSHFMGIAARAMRQVLVDAARRRKSVKRGGDAIEVELDDSHVAPADARHVSPDDIIALDQALAGLEAMNPRQANVVECRVFAGLSIEETARALDVSEPTIKRDWQSARAWLAHALGHG